MSTVRPLSDGSRLVVFAGAVLAVLALGAGIGSIVGPIDAGSGHNDHPVTSTSLDPSMEMTTDMSGG